MSPLFVNSESWERDAPSDLTSDLKSSSIDVHALLASRRQIALVWSIEDVQQVRPDLSEEQAWRVLQEVADNLDATSGINWEVLEMVADHLFRK